MNWFKTLDYKKLIVPGIIVVVGIGSFFFQKYKLNNTEVQSTPVIQEEVVLKKDTKLSSIKIDGVDFTFKEDVLEYDLVVGNDIESLDITAITTDGENADVKLGNGNKLLVGNNKITVDVKTNNKVVKYTFNVYRKKVTLTCPENTTLDGDKCITKNFIQAAKIDYSCPSDSKLEGSRCMKVEIKNATVHESCETGYTKVGNTCQKIETKDKVITDFTCPERSNTTIHFDGKVCQYEERYTAQTTFRCYNGGTLNGDMCERYVDYMPMEEEIYFCSEENCPGHTRRFCPSGMRQVSSNECARIDYEPAEMIFECLRGGGLVSGSQCLNHYTMAASDIKYGCQSGYKETATGKCEKLLSKETFKNMSCSKGFTYQDGKCIKESSTEAKEKLSCPTGLKIDTSTKKCYEELLSEPTKTEEQK